MAGLDAWVGSGPPPVGVPLPLNLIRKVLQQVSTAPILTTHNARQQQALSRPSSKVNGLKLVIQCSRAYGGEHDNLVCLSLALSC